MILDESLSIGSVGKRGAGLTDLFKDEVSVADVDIIIGSIGHAFGATGGFCAGSRAITDHQRLGGQAYCFSASLPALLTTYALNVIKCMPSIKEDSSEISTSPEALLKCRKTIQNSLESLPRNIKKMSESIKSQLPPNFEIRNIDSPSCLLYIQMRNKDFDYKRDCVHEGKILQEIVCIALEKDIYISRSKIIDVEELNILPPSIKICISGAFSEIQIEKMIDSLIGAFIEVDKKLSASR